MLIALEDLFKEYIPKDNKTTKPCCSKCLFCRKDGHFKEEDPLSNGTRYLVGMIYLSKNGNSDGKEISLQEILPKICMPEVLKELWCEQNAGRYKREILLG